jgi:hypothetical protein
MKPATRRRAHLREAAAMLVLARLAVRFVAPARIFAWADRPPRRERRFAGEEARWVLWSVETVGARRWMNALCLPRALAAHAMLRRRGIASRLCLGVARAGGELSAHAWVETRIETGWMATGQECGFTRLAAFGAAAR